MKPAASPYPSYDKCPMSRPRFTPIDPNPPHLFSLLDAQADGIEVDVGNGTVYVTFTSCPFLS
jgi:hypothetical protein